VNPCDTESPKASLETPRLRLRRLVSEDADWLSELDSDPEVMRFITGGIPRPREEFERVYLPRMLRSYERGPQFGFWAAALRTSGRLVGWFHLRPEQEEPFEMDLGYRLRRDVWGQGLATEGSRELLRRAFTEWNVPRVVAHTLATNTASRRVMEKCGLQWDRDFICPESWLPGWSEGQRRAVWYGINAADFPLSPRPVSKT
jgi:RimJ/RimL family protein N-acetyltransferase